MKRKFIFIDVQHEPQKDIEGLMHYLKSQGWDCFVEELET
jgi:hypothetical protein